MRNNNLLNRFLKCFGMLIAISIVSLSSVFANVANPTVIGPIVCGQNGITCDQPNGLPQNTQTIHTDFTASGYKEQEFFIQGNATSYTSTTPLTADGNWNNIIPDTTAAYKTRVLVRTPIKPSKFNGTVLVEWSNVSAGFDLDFSYSTLTTPTLASEGMAYILVTAQQAGVNGLKALDPARYTSLTHPGDAFSYDIFSQLGQALTQPSDINLLGGLNANKVIATGISQGGSALVTYVNGVQPLTQMFDGFLISAQLAVGNALLASDPLTYIFPLQVRNDDQLQTPVINFEDETSTAGDVPYIFGIEDVYYLVRQPDNAFFRAWEIAGAAHLTAFMLQHLGLNPLTGLPPTIFGCTAPVNDGLVHHYVSDAALHALNVWVNTGVMPAVHANVLSVDPPDPNVNPILPILNVQQFNNQIGPDGLPFGIAIGGIRTPFVDVPIGVHSGKGNGPLNNANCLLLGTSIPYDEATLKSLYPNHGSYVSQVIQSTKNAVKQGFITKKDSVEIIQNATKSNVGK